MDRRTLIAGATHLAYEWTAVVDAAALLATVGGQRSAEENAFLEAGLVHYRNVVTFCCGDYKGRWRHRDDMKPSDFLGRDWWPDDEELDRRLRGRLPEINQNLQHLSWKRITDEILLWPFGLLAHEAHFVMSLFLAQVPDDAPFRLALDHAQATAETRIPPRQKWGSTAVTPAPVRVL